MDKTLPSSRARPLQRWKRREGEDDFATSSVGTEFYVVRESDYNALKTKYDLLEASRSESAPAGSSKETMRPALEAIIARVDELEKDDHRPVPFEEVRALQEIAQGALKRLGERDSQP